jgi:GNAT superfamily N-acetyltransferase
MIVLRSDIRLATEEDIPELIELWKSCFPEDSEEYIRYFYRENFSRIRVPVYSLNGKIVSMIHLMDAVFANGTDEYPVQFVYAVGTRPDCRGKGILQSLLLSVFDSAKENGYGMFLKPSPELMNYYTRIGFAEDSRFRIFTIEAVQDGQKDFSCAPLSAEEYNRLRNRAFSTRPFVKWPDEHIRWCVDENDFCGGRTLSLKSGNDTHFLMCCPEGDVLRIIETDLEPDQLKTAAFGLCKMFGKSRLKAYLPEEVFREGPDVVSSLVFNAPLRQTYANLLLF